VKRLDLRGRVVLASVAVLGAGLLALSVAGNLLLATRLSDDASSILRTRADGELATLDSTGGALRLRDTNNDAALDQQSWVYDARGRAIERAPSDPRLQAAANALADVTRPTERTVGDSIRLLAVPARRDRGSARIGVVVVGTSLVPYRHTERIALVGTLVIDLFALIAGALLVRRAVGLALRPVAEMTARAADWSERDLHRRFGLGPPRDELTGLAATLDGLLERIDGALRHEQRFSAEMAHELRTPLSGVRGEAELALRADTPDDELRAALERVLAGTDRMAAVIDTLLTAARSDADRPQGDSDARTAVATVLSVLEPVAAAHGVRLDVELGSVPLGVGAESAVVAQALHPLVDNAVHHARGAVAVSLARDDGHVIVAVGDDGPGLDAEAVERIFEPGVSDTGSAGLGLPLARRLARACGGEVAARADPAGGRFELRLPATSSVGPR
jgi:two-component system OmpR family sensor kinase